MSPEEFMKEYEAANRSHDLERVRALISQDALFWFSNGTSHPGIERIADAIKYNFTTIEDDDYKAGPFRWIVRTDTCAVCVYPFRWTGKIGGKAVEGSGRGTSVLEKREGRWLMVHEHLSKGPA
jgi:ketosteroid isomerase-like protein